MSTMLQILFNITAGGFNLVAIMIYALIAVLVATAITERKRNR